MEEVPQIPAALKVVAALFILSGVSAVLEMLFALFQSRININFGVIGLFVGLGLLGLRPGWRTCALVLLWIGMIGTPVIGLLMLGSSAPLNFAVFGVTIGHIPKPAGFVMAAALFLLAVWQYRVLTRPDIRALFGLAEDGETTRDYP